MRPSAPSNTRNALTRSASRSAAAASSSREMPSSTSSPGPIAPTRRSSTVTLARLTRCTRARIERKYPPRSAEPEEVSVSYQTLLYDSADALATITLNRPTRLNTIVPPMPDELEAAVRRALAEEEVKVIVLRGAGRAFCAGFDFGGGFHHWDAHITTDGAWDAGKDFMTATSQALGAVPKFMSLWRSPKPVIAQVHGWCVGGGSDLALAAIPLSQLSAMKLIVNQAYENMGLASTQLLGPVLDGLMRNTPQAHDFIELAEREGVGSVVARRDGPFGDYSQAPRDEQPDPA